MLLERERVDRAHQPQVALELAGAPGERRAVGNRRRRRVERDVRLDVVLGAERLDRALEPQPRLRVLDLGPLHPLARLDELALEPAALDAQPVELLRRRARRLGLAAPALAQPSCRSPTAARCSPIRAVEPRVRGVALEERRAGAAPPRPGPRGRAPRGALDLREPRAMTDAPLLDRGAPDFRSRARRRARPGPPRPRARLRPRATSASTARSCASSSAACVTPATASRRRSARDPSPPIRSPVGRDRDETRVREHEVEGACATVDQHGVREQTPRAPRAARARRVGPARQRARAGRHERRLRRRRPVGSVTSRSACASPSSSCSIARRSASPRSTTTARIASPSADATAASAPGSISRWSTSGPTTPSTLSSSSAPAAARAVRNCASSASARARQPCGLRLRRAPPLLGRAQRLLGHDDRGTRVGAGQREVGGLRVELGDLGPQLDRVGDERLDDAFVGGGRQLALHTAALLVDQCGEAAAALAQRLGAHQPFGEVVVAQRGERVLGLDDGFVERAQPVAQLGLSRVSSSARSSRSRSMRVCEPGDLVAGEVQLDRAQLGHDRAVPLGGLGLALQRRELAPHLAQEVVEAEQVALGRGEPALGALLAFPVLQDARRPPRRSRGGRPGDEFRIVSS